MTSFNKLCVKPNNISFSLFVFLLFYEAEIFFLAEAISFLGLKLGFFATDIPDYLQNLSPWYFIPWFVFYYD